MPASDTSFSARRLRSDWCGHLRGVTWMAVYARGMPRRQTGTRQYISGAAPVRGQRRSIGRPLKISRRIRMGIMRNVTVENTNGDLVPLRSIWLVILLIEVIG